MKTWIMRSSCKKYSQRGASLIVALLMLIAVLLLGISAAQNALQSEKSSRNDRDRQIAFQAAEAALMDAELDIEHSPDAAHSRSSQFSKNSTQGFPGDEEKACGVGDGNLNQGLCRHMHEGEKPTWQSIDFLNEQTSSAASVRYGRFTGKNFATGKGSLPFRAPRYVIELMKYNRQGTSADQHGASYFYRVTAIGFGARDNTQVMLQTFYRKED